jgi:hypothetical protein
MKTEDGRRFGGASSLDQVLAAWEGYRTSLLVMLNDIGLEPHEGRSPDIAFARVLVAATVRGTALPQGRFFSPYDVIGSDGARIAVYSVDDLSHPVNGWVVLENRLTEIDALALVAFSQRRPQAVHLIPTSSAAAVSSSVGVGGAPEGSLTMNRLLHEFLMLEPAATGALGVTTTVLHPNRLSEKAT